jgi:hypothetical protein
MGDSQLWLFLFCLAAGEVLAVVLCIRWFLSQLEVRQQNFSSEALSLLVQRTILLCLIALPMCGFAIFLLRLRSTIVLSSMSSALLLMLLFFCLLLLLVTFFAIGELMMLLARHWTGFRNVFFLPADASKVRTHGCRQGILAAASAYPDLAFDDDADLDAFVRANAALLKAQQFPHARLWQYRLTNDFAAYCDLLSEGYRQGYRQFFAECQADSDRLAMVREHFLQPVSADDQLLSQYATRYLHA